MIYFALGLFFLGFVTFFILSIKSKKILTIIATDEPEIYKKYFSDPASKIYNWWALVFGSLSSELSSISLRNAIARMQRAYIFAFVCVIGYAVILITNYH